VRKHLLRTLHALNDVRLPGESRRAAAGGMSVQVIIIASIAGGVGSSIALPLCGEVKRAMDQLGMDVHQSVFIGACFGDYILGPAHSPSIAPAPRLVSAGDYRPQCALQLIGAALAPAATASAHSKAEHIDMSPGDPEVTVNVDISYAIG
jgi:hypothetical protein